MSTTSTFQGIDDAAKSSSRVLRPPGGGSSFSFGGEPTPAESASQSRSKQTSSNIFGAPYDPERDVTRSEKASAEREQKRQEHGQFETPTYVRAEKPQEDTQSKLFGDTSNQTRRGKGQGEEFPAYDRSVYAAQLTPQRRNFTRVSSHNPITGEAYSGTNEEDDGPVRTSKRKGMQNNIGAYNPITGEDYQTGTKDANGDGPQVRSSTKLHAPPGGKSSGIF